MLINNADLLHNQKKLSNCRIQSLCDLLVVNKYHVNPSLMYLSCLDTLLSYAEIRQNHIDLPLLSCFYDDIEARFLTEYGIPFHISNECLSLQSLKEDLRKDKPFIILCDSNSILRKKMNTSNVQVGVVSGITIIGYNILGELIYSQFSKSNQFSTISYKMAAYSRSFHVLPASPMEQSIHLDNDNVIPEAQALMADYDSIHNKLCNCFQKFLVSDGSPHTNITNRGITGYYDYEAREQLMNYLQSMLPLLAQSTQGTAITDKVFALKIKMLRKSMISGTTTVNRNEIADGLEAFNEVNPSSRLRNLADGFKESAKNYRNIVRYLSTVDNYITRKVEFMDKVIADFYHAFQYESEILESFMK